MASEDAQKLQAGVGYAVYRGERSGFSTLQCRCYQASRRHFLDLRLQFRIGDLQEAVWLLSCRDQNRVGIVQIHRGLFQLRPSTPNSVQRTMPDVLKL